MIFTSLSPNTERDDVKKATALLFQPWKWKKGEAVARLEKEFKSYFNADYAYAFQSGRNALYGLLQALSLKEGDEVLLQSYTCVAVPEPVLWLKANPIYVDVLSDFTMDPEDLKKKITPRSKVLIIQHTFGHVAHLSELLEIAKQHNLFVIEDCAHAMGALYEGKKVGTFGDASFFSFGRDKVISSVFGGMLLVKDATLAHKVEDVRSGFHMPSLAYVGQQLAHPFILAISKKTYTFFSLGKVILTAARWLHMISKAVENVELYGLQPSFANLKMPNALGLLALHQFEKLDRFNTHRRSIARIYTDHLKDTVCVLPKFDITSVPVYLRYTILVQNPAKLMKKAKARNIELGDWYQQPIAPNHVDYQTIRYDENLCPKAQELAAQSINLPTHIQISEQDAHTIIKLVKDYAG